jgi:tRNA (cmo5U34)-methyltransferase
MSGRVNLWVEPEHARRYLGERADIPHQTEAMAALAEFVPASATRVLDLGTGDGISMALVLDLCRDATGVAADFSEEMLGRARARFAGQPVEVVRHDLDEPLPGAWGTFDLVVSSFAIHHLPDARKRALSGEVFERLVPGGRFLNLEHVASSTTRLHDEFLAAMGRTPAEDDPSNLLAPVGEQLAWLRSVGFEDVDCHWKWRELALIGANRPT